MLNKDEQEAKILAKMDRIKGGAGGVIDEQKFNSAMSQRKLPEIQSETELFEPAEQTNRIRQMENEASSETEEDSADVKSEDVSNEKLSESNEEAVENIEESSDESSKETESHEDLENSVPDFQKGVKNYAERKINKVTAKLHNAHDEIQELKLKLHALEAQRSVELPVTVPTVNDYQYIDPTSQSMVEMPRAEHFSQNPAQYFEAMRSFEHGKKNALNFWQQQQKQYLEQERLNNNFVQNLQDVKQKNIYRDFDNVVNRSKMELIDQYQPQLSEAIKGSPHAAHLLYGICKNSELQQEFLTMQPHRALVELGKMEYEMELAMKPNNVVTKAPPPIQNKPSSGARKAQSVSKDASNISQRELNARMKDRMRRGL